MYASIVQSVELSPWETLRLSLLKQYRSSSLGDEWFSSSSPKWCWSSFPAQDIPLSVRASPPPTSHMVSFLLMPGVPITLLLPYHGTSSGSSQRSSIYNCSRASLPFYLKALKWSHHLQINHCLLILPGSLLSSPGTYTTRGIRG